MLIPWKLVGGSLLNPQNVCAMKGPVGPVMFQSLNSKLETIKDFNNPPKTDSAQCATFVPHRSKLKCCCVLAFTCLVVCVNFLSPGSSSVALKKHQGFWPYSSLKTLFLVVSWVLWIRKPGPPRSPAHCFAENQLSRGFVCLCENLLRQRET